MDATEQADIEDRSSTGRARDTGSNGRPRGDDGRDATSSARLKSGGTRYEYIDAQTYYQIRSDSTRKARKGTVKLQAKFSDFKKSSGILFPRRIEVQAQGRPNRLRLEVDQIDVNPKLSDSRFELPPSAKN
jgi:hypothetical protein